MAAIEDVCTACGERNPAGSAFCLYCGVYLGWDEAGSADSPAARRSVPAGEVSSEAPTRSDPTLLQPGVQAQQGERYQPSEQHISPTEPLCPQCGRPNATTLRFCGRCGRALRPSRSPTHVGATPTTQSWWRRFWDPSDRRSRRAYRRSLPPFYRWRRVLITLGTIVAAVVLLSVVGTNPLGWTKDRYNDLRGTLVAVDQIVYTAEPPNSVADGWDVKALGSPAVDDAWVTAWPVQKLLPAKGCGGKPAGPGMIRLIFEQPVRIRALDVLTGLPPDNSERQLLYRPKVLLVMYGTGQCSSLELQDVSTVQHLKMDTQAAVGSLTIAVGDAYEGPADARKPFVALTTLTALARPH